MVINNNTSSSVGAQVTTQERDDGAGGIMLDIMIDQMVSNKMRDGGSLIIKVSVI